MRQHIEALENLQGQDAGSVRKRVIEVLRDAAGADAAAFYDVVASQGRLHYGSAASTGGGSALTEAFQALAGEAIYENPLIDFCRPRVVEIEQFMDFETRVRWVGERTVYESEAFQRLYQPGRISSDLRLLVYEGRRFVGWVGALRTAGSAPFGARDRRRLLRLVAPVKAALSAAERIETAHLPVGPAYLLASPSGEMQHASAMAQWLVASHEFVERLAARVRAFDHGEDLRSIFDLGLVECRIVRLDATGRVAYLVSVLPALRPALRPEAQLTEAQRKVADLAATGATVATIAERVGSKPETVRTHLREVYRRLHVATRLELAAALAPPRPASEVTSAATQLVA